MFLKCFVIIEIIAPITDAVIDTTDVTQYSRYAFGIALIPLDSN